MTAATLSEWREALLVGAEANLESREPTPADGENLPLKARIGELTMENGLLREKVEKLEVNAPNLPWMKSRP